MAYFDLFPDLLLPSFTDNRNSSYAFTKTKNLFKRAKIRDDFFQNAIAFDQFSIQGDDRPDQVAQRLYGDAELDWIVLLSNNIINVRDEWPMGQYDLDRYLSDKYSAEQLEEIHHYETLEVRASDGRLLLSGGMWVDENFQFKYSYGGVHYVLAGASLVKGVSYYDYELEKNDDKRVIYALRPEYLEVVVSDMREIMTYTDSSQYIDKRTKKGDNLRILSPR
jgi:hypothetical protein